MPQIIHKICRCGTMQNENERSVFVNGVLQVDYADGFTYLNGEKFHLTPIEYRLFACTEWWQGFNIYRFHRERRKHALLSIGAFGISKAIRKETPCFTARSLLPFYEQILRKPVQFRQTVIQICLIGHQTHRRLMRHVVQNADSEYRIIDRNVCGKCCDRFRRRTGI